MRGSIRHRNSGFERWTPAVVCFVVVAFCGPTAARAGHVQFGFPASIRVSDDGCDLHLRVQDGGRTLKVDSKGCYDVADDERDISSIDKRGYFRAEERRLGRVRQSIEIRSNDAGSLDRVYKRDGDTASIDTAAQEWFAEVLRTVSRYNKAHAERHLQRVLQRDGIEGAIKEIALYDGSYDKRVAYSHLMKLPEADGALVERLAPAAGRGIDSDYELAEFVVAATRVPAVTPAALVACADASHQIDSDYEHRKALHAILENSACDASVLEAVLRGALDLDSDHERAELLRDVNDKHMLGASLVTPYFAAVDGIDSDYEHARVLQDLLDGQDLTPELLQGIARSAGRIDSDYHKGQVLEALANGRSLDAATREACLEAAHRIDSDYHRSRVLAALR